MSSWMKRTALASVAALALMGAAQAEVVYNRANAGEPETLDTHKTSTVQEAHILRDLLEGLVTYNAKGEAIPGQASKWEISDDGKVYRFTLRDGIKWSNGDPVKASDFVYSYRRIMDPATGSKYANILYSIKGAEAANKGKGKIEDIGVKAVDDKTLEITLEQPTPYFVELLTHQTSLPVNPASVEKFGKDFVKPGNMVSNGAYKLAEFVPNSHIKMVKNDQYYDAKNVQIDTVMYYPTPDFAAMVRRYEAGELDTTDDLPGDQMKSIKERFKDQVRLGPYLGTYFLVVNSSKAPLNDVKVRQALAMGLDREFIAEQIWGNTMQPGYSFMPTGVGNYGTPAMMDAKDLSPIDREDKAKALLKEAGFGPGKPLKVEIRYNTTDNNRNTVVAVAEQWKQIGVETSFINTDGKTHFAYLRDGRRLRRGPLRLDRGLLGPGELPVPAQERQQGLQLRQVQQSGIRRPAEPGREGARPRQACRDHEESRDHRDAGHALDPADVLRQEPPDLAEDQGLRAEHARRLPVAVPVEDPVGIASREGAVRPRTAPSPVKLPPP